MTTSPTPTSPEPAEGSTPSDEASTSGSEHVMDMLGEHVPLSLLMDLTSPTGPDSVTIHDDEGLPEDSWWDLGGGDGAASDAGEAGTER
ncbi:hypothetical protein WDZ16_13125 [Pseudokineococcus marinus]|uniref:Uncharacterized protein n=1 Tax=Pseudokineococcus marinus TaxID=351215 RepID=A0A849BJN9_9ACTN|nr:hypothetical protein [Pseudokineococcus marinus]NNH23410.1 hypothetical protein [Pseudokineococcus marinus]